MSVTIDGNNAATVGLINSKTAVASTSGANIDFTDTFDAGSINILYE